MYQFQLIMEGGHQKLEVLIESFNYPNKTRGIYYETQLSHTTRILLQTVQIVGLGFIN